MNNAFEFWKNGMGDIYCQKSKCVSKRWYSNSTAIMHDPRTVYGANSLETAEAREQTGIACVLEIITEEYSMQNNFRVFNF